MSNNENKTVILGSLFKWGGLHRVDERAVS